MVTRDDLLDALTRNVVGKPASVCDWRDLLRVRDHVDDLLNGEVNRRQNPTSPASTSRPAADGHIGGSPNRRVASGDSFAAETRPAPNTVRRHVTPVVAPDGHPTRNAAPRGTSQEVTKCWQ